MQSLATITFRACANTPEVSLVANNDNDNDDDDEEERTTFLDSGHPQDSPSNYTYILWLKLHSLLKQG